MMNQHLYLVVPPSCASNIHAEITLDTCETIWGKFGWKHEEMMRVSVAVIGRTSEQVALHLCFRNDAKHLDWVNFLIELADQTDIEDPLGSQKNIKEVEKALGIRKEIFICLDVDDLKERCPDFAVINHVSDGEGGTVDVPVLKDTVFAV